MRNEVEITELIEELAQTGNLSDEGFRVLLEEERCSNETAQGYIALSDFSAVTSKLGREADRKRREIYGTDVYIRGLIEFTNYCKNNCYYCGIRSGNGSAVRYRLDKEVILNCCEEGYRLGFRTFVLQGGEDAYFTDEKVCDLVASIKDRHPDCAITLSIGEKDRDSYEAYYRAGADRYLLRHETADEEHYGRLHPENLKLSNRKRCLYDLKDIGYQVGAGFMVGSPFQDASCLLSDIRFLQELKPHMIGIGPYINHRETPFKDCESGNAELALRLISIIRLILPSANIPSTTAMGTVLPYGRELGLMAGANVIMPNLSPVSVREYYSLYENKICTGEESAECRSCLDVRVKNAGYNIVVDVGDAKCFHNLYHSKNLCI